MRSVGLIRRNRGVRVRICNTAAPRGVGSKDVCEQWRRGVCVRDEGEKNGEGREDGDEGVGDGYSSSGSEAAFGLGGGASDAQIVLVLVLAGAENGAAGAGGVLNLILDLVDLNPTLVLPGVDVQPRLVLAAFHGLRWLYDR
ncbi:hypothetical protein STAS_30285 [Striga asiatica]|uniref:Uncharacterized protein n=1 Tax=Striga asiatica TaxID=4170 RepID=A0A5A7R553_STRAF|nr:hypothetical protein STAS_30285 [Striga asiatica]